MPPKKQPTLAARLRAAREASRLSQREAAEKAGISDETLNQLESGKMANPRLETLRALARVYGCTVGELAA